MLFLTSFAIVFLLGLQSKIVIANQHLWAMTVSFGISVCNLYIIQNVSVKDLDLLASIGYLSGGPLGIVSSMWFHDKFMARRRE